MGHCFGIVTTKREAESLAAALAICTPERQPSRFKVSEIDCGQPNASVNWAVEDTNGRTPQSWKLAAQVALVYGIGKAKRRSIMKDVFVELDQVNGGKAYEKPYRIVGFSDIPTRGESEFDKEHKMGSFPAHCYVSIKDDTFLTVTQTATEVRDLIRKAFDEQAAETV